MASGGGGDTSAGERRHKRNKDQGIIFLKGKGIKNQTRGKKFRGRGIQGERESNGKGISKLLGCICWKGRGGVV